MTLSSQPTSTALMLAVQRLSMGSSKPPNLDMPFGYSFDNQTSNFPFPSPTAPPPGPSLLDDNESRFLDSFFDGVSADTFNYDLFTNAPDGPELGLGWEELPPTFMGTTSSFGQQPQITSHGLSDSHLNHPNLHMNRGEPSIPASTPADVLAAATLLQNGSAVRAHSIGNEALFRNPDNTLQLTNGQMRAQSMSQYQPARPHERQTSDDFMRDTFYTDMVFGSQNHLPMPSRQTSSKDIRWGSDSGFGTPQGFVPPASQEKVSAVERYHIKAVEGAFEEIHVPSSTDTTRPSSPTQSRPSISHQMNKSTGRSRVEDDEYSRPQKRRKSKFQDEADDEEDSPTSANPNQGDKKRKALKKASSNDSPTPSSEQSHKRRKSTAAASAAAKASRENLTEDQKRENHIKSEQKRRTLIREGFEDLGELVPGLRGGGFSKSAVLIMAADWLEELIQGNEVLRRRLDSLQGRA